MEEDRFGQLTIEEPERDLLPGIPNDITLDLISPKLPWRTFYILSSVGRSWRRAIRSRQVYNARVLSEANEAMVVINYFQLNANFVAIGLYSVRDKSVSLLPSIPNVSTGIPLGCLSVAMDGKIYVLGGRWNDGYNNSTRDEVYVMDLAGQRQWQQCKSMAFRRWNFGLGVMNGKIYVFGGHDREERPVRTSEVYDPESNSWDPIKSMVPWRYLHQVTAIGEELFLHGGRTFDRERANVINGKRANLMHAYHPDKDEWRELPFGKELGVDREDQYISESRFVSQGRFHWMMNLGIFVHDMERNVWTSRYSFMCPEIIHALNNRPSLWSTLDADNELVTLLTWSPFPSHHKSDLSTLLTWSPFPGHHESDLFHCSIGLRGEEETIAWQKVECSHKIGYFPSISLIRL